ncbi:hypothetical protein JCM1841_002779 [Sporobolomyces salmonicolor]
MTSYTLASLAYLKLILHAAKFPTSTVCGLLVGTVDASSNTVSIVDAIPLLHHWTELSPMVEAGLQLADLFVTTQQQVFVGLYVANERLGDTAVPLSLEKVANAIRKERPEALVLVVDNDQLASGAPAILPYLPSASSWVPSNVSSAHLSLSDPSIPSVALSHVKSGRHALLGDFDEHLEDVKVDWLRNAQVVL